MAIHHTYNELDADDKKVYIAWLKGTLAFWALTSVFVVCTVLALDASMTTEQRIAISQQSGALP
jgi:hypothetical protein